MTDSYAMRKRMADNYVTTGFLTREEADRKFGILAPRPEEPHDDPVNHPTHYTSHPSGVECIAITRHYPFCTGNAIKYLWRAGLKHDSGMDDAQKQIEDLRKAAWYINEQIRLLEAGEASD